MTQKHKRNTKDIPITSINSNNNNNQIMFTIVENQNNLAKQNEEVIKQNEDLKKEIEKLKETNKILLDTNNQNTNKIVKEARAIKKSILTILNTSFKDTPSIDYIGENDFRIELEKEYRKKLDDPSYSLIMRIFNDYENKKLIQTLSNLILKFIKKEDQKNQSVFNIDSARGNFATKIEDIWHNDKSGLQLKKYTLEMVIKYMLNVLNMFGDHIYKKIKEKNKTSDDVEYIMKYQSLLFEVKAYLTNINTHKKVILFMCPELRVNNKLLELLP